MSKKGVTVQAERIFYSDSLHTTTGNLCSFYLPVNIPSISIIHQQNAYYNRLN